MPLSPTRSQVALVATLLALLVVAVFSPTLGYDFLLFDDNYFVFDNPNVRQGLTWSSLKWALTSTWGFLHPLTRLSHVVDWTIWGPRAGGHHLTNVLLHAFNTVVLFFGLRRLTQRLWPSSLAAALFALHPLNVEPVAWISERKVSCAQHLPYALWAYAIYCERRTFWRYLPVSCLYLLALMAKPMALTLPALFLLLDFWPLGRWGRLKPARCIVEKLPLLFLTLGFSALSYVALADVLSDAGRYEEAIPEYGQALRLRPKDVELRVRLAKAFDSAGKVDEATLQLVEVTHLLPREGKAHHALGSLYLRQGRIDDAIRELGEAVTLRPDPELAQRDLKKALREQKSGSESDTSTP